MSLVQPQQAPAIQTTTNQIAQPPPIQMSHDSAPHYGHTYPSGRLRSPPPQSKEVHPDGEDDDEGMYASEDVDQGGDEAERGDDHHVELGGPDSGFGDTTSHRTSLSGDVAAAAKSVEAAGVGVGVS